MRYYSTQRPVGPGTFPKPQGNAVKEVFNFDNKTYCEEVGREARGYIEYEKLLTQLEEEMAACQYAYGEMVPVFYAEALRRAIGAIRECRDCEAEATRMAREVRRT